MLTKNSTLTAAFLLMLAISAHSALAECWTSADKLTDWSESIKSRTPGQKIACDLKNEQEVKLVKDLTASMQKAAEANKWQPANPSSGNALRFFGTKGDELIIVCVRRSVDKDSPDAASACRLTIDEKERDTLIGEQLSNILQTAGGSNETASAPASYPFVLEIKGYCLEKKRATVTITPNISTDQLETVGGTCRTNGKKSWIFLDERSQAAVKEQKQSAKDKQSAAQDKQSSAQPTDAITVKTGPPEHLFLSADLPVNKISILKYDTTSHSLVEKSTPSAFLVSLNISPTDVVKVPVKVQDFFFLKIMASASSRPQQNFGLGLGIRGRKIFKYLDLTPISLFFAETLVESDALSTTSQSKIGSSYTRKSQLGISFDITKAVSWLKK